MPPNEPVAPQTPAPQVDSIATPAPAPVTAAVQPSLPPAGQAPLVVMPSASADYKGGMMSAQTTTKLVPLLYVSAGLSYIIFVLCLFVGKAWTEDLAYLGFILGGTAGLTGYRSKRKPLMIVGYIAFGLNAITALLSLAGIYI